MEPNYQEDNDLAKKVRDLVNELNEVLGKCHAKNLRAVINIHPFQTTSHGKREEIHIQLHRKVL